MADIKELADMNDEEFMENADKIEPEEESNEDSQNSSEEENAAPANEEETEDNAEVDNSGSSSGSNNEVSEADSEATSQEESSEDKASESSSEEQAAPVMSAEDYEQFYKQVMMPIKANGKLIKLNSANDVISLIQQGANYTKKMQSIAPYRKQLKMLEDNELLDNDKIRFLIDVAKHDKDAIRKLLSEAKIDASDLSYDDETDEEGNPKPVQYYPKTPNVSDQEVAWSEAWKELLEQEKLDNVNTHDIIINMDSASQKQVYENPQILGLMHMTQACGAYDKIVNEMDRLKTLGYIQENAPFLSTFVEVKNLMLQHGLLNDEVAKLNGGTLPQELARRAYPPKKNTVADDKRVKAAAPSRSTGKRTKPFLNPLNMSDEEFLKRYDEI